MLVGAEGPLDAKIVLIGEAPGAEEEKQGKPFVGGSGQLLNQVLSGAGIDRSRCYVTNIMQVRPPSNNFASFYEDSKRQNPSSLLLAGLERLRGELSRLQPNVIVPLGAEPLRAVTGLHSIEKWRGSILSSPFGKVVSTYHPAAVLREYKLRPILQLDAKRVATQSVFADVRIPQHTFHVDPSFDKVISWLRAIQKGQLISFDIETIGNLVRCLGIGISRHEAMCIPFMSSPYRFRPGEIGNLLSDTPGSQSQMSSHWKEDEEYVILQELDRILSDPEIEKTAQNYPFDSTRLEKQFGLVVKGLRLDTLLGFHCCYAELPKGLDFLCSIYTDVPYYSDYNVAADLEVWKYNCYDCAVTFEIVEPIERDLRQMGLDEFYTNHVQPAMFALTRAENRGIRVDKEVKEKERVELLKEVEYEHKKKKWAQVGTLTQEIRDLVKWQEFNPKSPKQMCELFYDRLGMNKQFNPKTKSLTADEKAREKLMRMHPEHLGLLTLIDTWMEKITLINSFLSRELREDGRMYTHYNVAGTVTGRISSGKPLVDTDEATTNLTNIPRGKFRRMFLADEGEFLIKADLKSAEWMVVCWACPVQRYIEKYRENPDWDIHRFAGSQVYSVPEEQITKEQRSYAKNGVYGGGYGMQPQRAASTWKVPIQVAAFVLDRWHKVTPEIKQLYWKKIQHAINSSRCIENMLGRKRMFFDRINYPPSELDQIYRDAYSHYPQSTVADIINRAFALMDHFFPESHCRLLLQVHDEIVGSCKREYVPQFVRLFKSFMEYPIVIPGAPTPLTIQAEVTVGPNWFEQKTLEEFLKQEQAA
jgi:uracil-DNA glycosylase family 4